MAATAQTIYSNVAGRQPGPTCLIDATEGRR